MSTTCIRCDHRDRRAKDSGPDGKIFGDEIGWLSGNAPASNWVYGWSFYSITRGEGVVLESHGLFTWGDTPKECYDTTVATINKAIAWFEKATKGKPAFGGAASKSLKPAERRDCRPHHAEDPRHDFRRRAIRSVISTIPTLCWNSSTRRICARWRRSARPVPIIS
jgi:rhamnose utilization protein RhaD (predicted bifunctional aldolase and dehydrogenase)